MLGNSYASKVRLYLMQSSALLYGPRDFLRHCEQSRCILKIGCVRQELLSLGSRLVDVSAAGANPGMVASRRFRSNPRRSSTPPTGAHHGSRRSVASADASEVAFQRLSLLAQWLCPPALLRIPSSPRDCACLITSMRSQGTREINQADAHSSPATPCTL